MAPALDITGIFMTNLGSTVLLVLSHILSGTLLYNNGDSSWICT